MQKYYSYRSGKSVIHKSWKSAHNGRYYKREVIKANEVATIHIGLAPSTVSMMAKQFKASMRPLADKCFVYKIDSDELITEVLLAWNKEKVTDEIKEFLEFLFNQFD